MRSACLVWVRIFQHVIQALLSQFGYLAIFALLVAGGLAVPVPEELVQLTAGVLAHRGLLSPVPAALTCWLGILVGDTAWFLLARRHGERLLATRHVRRVLTDSRRAWVERHLASHALLTVMISRHLSAVRLAAYALAATHGVRPRTFVLADGLSALLSVPLVVGAGYLGSQHLAQVHQDVRRVELAVLAAAAAAVAGWLLLRRLRRPATG
ncbi:MAG: DedA family protein [Anaeromyxobacter sp.]